MYETDPLEEDLTIAGPISPQLRVAQSGTDSDFVVKLIDVYPDDYSRAGRLPKSSRRILQLPQSTWAATSNCCAASLARQVPPQLGEARANDAGQGRRIDFSMPDLAHASAAGTASWCRSQSSWFPLVDRNPQTFTDIPFARPEDFQKATGTDFSPERTRPAAWRCWCLPH